MPQHTAAKRKKKKRDQRGASLKAAVQRGLKRQGRGPRGKRLKGAPEQSTGTGGVNFAAASKKLRDEKNQADELARFNLKKKQADAARTTVDVKDRIDPGQIKVEEERTFGQKFEKGELKERLSTDEPFGFSASTDLDPFAVAGLVGGPVASITKETAAIIAKNKIAKSVVGTIKNTAEEITKIAQTHTASGNVIRFKTTEKSLTLTQRFFEKIFTKTQTVTSTNARTGKVTETLVQSPRNPITLGVAALGIFGSYPFAQFIRNEAIDRIGMVGRDARQAGNIDLAEESTAHIDQVLERTNIEKFFGLFPGVNTLAAGIEFANEGLFVNSVNKELNAEARIKLDTGASDQEIWDLRERKRRALDKISQIERDVYFRNQKNIQRQLKKEDDALRKEERTADREAFTANQRELNRERHAYFIQQQEIINDNIERRRQQELQDQIERDMFFAELRAQSTASPNFQPRSALNFGLLR